MNTESIISLINAGKETKSLYESSSSNLLDLVKCTGIPVRILNSIEELLTSENWEELNNRFHTDLKFGTGGMRGRTIGNFITESEKGNTKKNDPPPVCRCW